MRIEQDRVAFLVESRSPVVLHAAVAQLVEQALRKRQVVRSSRTSGTVFPHLFDI